MDEKKYAELKKVIIAAVPSIMELKHGCYFRWNGDTWFVNCERCDDKFTFAYSCTGDAHSWPDALQVTEKTAWNYKYKNFSKEDQREIEILGRPIRLADVLISIQNKKNYKNGACESRWQENRINVVCGEPFPCEKHDNVSKKMLSMWNLLDDSLNNQSDACKEFLYDILIKR